MDAKKYEKIRDFLLVWDYKPEDITNYLKQVAPEMLTDNGQKARHEAMNAYLSGVFGVEHKTPEPIKIARPSENSGFAHDLWLLLGLADDPITVNDLAAYTSERLNRIDAEQRRKAGEETTFMSNMLRSMNQNDYAAEAEEVAETLWRKHERLHSDKRSMNEILSGLVAKDAQTVTLVDPPRFPET